MKEKKPNKWECWQKIIFIVFITWFLGINLWLAYAESQTIDEAAHITAGYSYLKTGDFRLNPEHPPLLKELSALPLLQSDVKNPADLSGWRTGDQWQAGKDFVYHSQASARRIIFSARIMPILISLILALLVFKLTTFLSSRSFGLFALGLYVFDPNIIAHSHLVTNDIASALGFLGGLALSFYYLNKPGKLRLVLLGIGLGVAFAFKFSTLLLILFVPILQAISVFWFEKLNLSYRRKLLLLLKRLAAITVIAFFVLWLFYGFEFVKPSANEAAIGTIGANNRIFEILKDLYIPFYSYVRGLGRFLVHSASASNQSVYLLGNYSDGQWYYFLAAFVIKTPAIIIAAALSSMLIGIKKLSRIIKAKALISKTNVYIISLAAFILIYVLLSLFSHINIGWRHILPVYPPLFILIALALNQYVRISINPFRSYIAAFIIIIGGLALTTFCHFPNYIGYSNEFLPIVDDRTNRPRLTDSNLDWGQDLYRFLDYSKDNPEKTFKYDLFTNANIAWLYPPANISPLNGEFDVQTCNLKSDSVLAISYQVLYNDSTSNVYDCIRGSRPNKIIGSSILIFE